MVECFQINSADNVATLLEHADAGSILVRGAGAQLGSEGQRVLAVREAIELGHKVALSDISSGAAIVKYGVRIGQSTRTILQGEWVHLHNCASCIDERSAGMDVHSGLAGDIAYE